MKKVFLVLALMVIMTTQVFASSKVIDQVTCNKKWVETQPVGGKVYFVEIRDSKNKLETYVCAKKVYNKFKANNKTKYTIAVETTKGAYDTIKATVWAK